MGQCLDVPERPRNVAPPEPERPVQDEAQEVKVVLLGESGVGKSSLALRFCQGKYSKHHEVTIGAAFLQQYIRVNDRQVKLLIWDTGGQDRFRAMAPLYYRDSKGAIVVLDLGNRDSFEAVTYWIDELRAKGPPDCQIAVAANKADLDDYQIELEEVREYCKAKKIDLLFETSAKTGAQVGELFQSLSNQIFA